jgi:hypothetical protein
MADQVLLPKRRPAISCVPGERFGRLTVLEVLIKDGRQWARVRCSCEAKTEKEVRARDLQNGTTRGCGCLLREVTAQRNWTHGLSKHPLYMVWCHMLDRCENPSNISYHNYGGRGITICERWQSVENFIEDMASGYRTGLTLERRNNALGYSPENCGWGTRKVQQRNTRSNRIIDTPLGRMTLAEAAELSGIGDTTLVGRLDRGWPIDRLFMPAIRGRLINTPAGPLTVAQAVKRSGLTKNTVRGRVRLGWSPERLFDPSARQPSGAELLGTEAALRGMR